MSGEIRRCLARSRSFLYFAARSAREVLSAARITGTMIPSSASTAMPISIEFDCTTRLPINFATAMTNKPEVVGQTLRPGSTSMWAGLRFSNGYSPIRAAGVAREFATSIHGEINPDVGSISSGIQSAHRRSETPYHVVSRIISNSGSSGRHTWAAHGCV
jgi:hypothetical protein